MFNNQFRPALRFLARHKGYTGINILGLTLGLCACLAIYNIVSYEFNFDRSFPASVCSGLSFSSSNAKRKRSASARCWAPALATSFLLNKEFVALVGIALAIASPIAFLGMHRWLQGFAYRIAISWWIFVLAGLIIVAISLFTISLHCRFARFWSKSARLSL